MMGTEIGVEGWNNKEDGDGHLKCVKYAINHDWSNVMVASQPFSATLPTIIGPPGMVLEVGLDGIRWVNPVDPGALPSAWTESPLASTETTENQPIVDIMAITRGMCK